MNSTEQLKFSSLGRAPCKFSSDCNQVKSVSLGKCAFADLMLFKVVIAAQADHPSVRWFECHSAIGAATDMRAFDGATRATIDAAVMAPDPCSVRRAFTFTGEAPRVLDWGW